MRGRPEAGAPVASEDARAPRSQPAPAARPAPPRPTPLTRRSRLAPFGIRVEPFARDTDPAELPLAMLGAWVLAHRVLVLRGFAPLDGDDFPAFGRSLGELCAGGAGEAADPADACIVCDPDVWTDHEVPMHWDQAAGRSPRYLLFHCDTSPPRGGGGETLFSDTTRVLARTQPFERAAWSAAQQKRGGAIASHEPRIERHPVTGESVLRYVESLAGRRRGRGEDSGTLVGSLDQRLYDPAVCYPHHWHDGDVLLADNHALLHARAPFARGERRLLRRVNVL